MARPNVSAPPCVLSLGQCSIHTRGVGNLLAWITPAAITSAELVIEPPGLLAVPSRSPQESRACRLVGRSERGYVSDLRGELADAESRIDDLENGDWT